MGVLFGAGPVMDAFTVAFRLPNLARVLLGEGALTTAFLPVFLADLNERGKDSAARVTWAVVVSLAFFLTFLIVLVEAVLWSLAWAIPLSSEAQLLRNLTALLTPYVLLICLAAQLGAVLNALGRFVWPALVPSILNLIWLIALWGFIPRWDDEVSRIYVTAVSVLVGGALQLLFPRLENCTGHAAGNYRSVHHPTECGARQFYRLGVHPTGRRKCHHAISRVATLSPDRRSGDRLVSWSTPLPIPVRGLWSRLGDRAVSALCHPFTAGKDGGIACGCLTRNSAGAGDWSPCQCRIDARWSPAGHPVFSIRQI